MATWKSASGASMTVANNFATLAAAVPPFLNAVDAAHRVVGAAPLAAVSSVLNAVSGNYVPAWNPYMPRGAAPLKPPVKPPAPAAAAAATGAREIPRKVVYLPSCVTRMMGPALSDPERESVHEKLMSIFSKVRSPTWLLACGTVVSPSASPCTKFIKAHVHLLQGARPSLAAGLLPCVSASWHGAVQAGYKVLFARLLPCFPASERGAVQAGYKVLFPLCSSVFLSASQR